MADLFEDLSRLSLYKEAASTNISQERLAELAFKDTELLRTIAQNANTSGDILQRLSTNNDEVIRRYITNNPNTPTETLFALGEEFPQELLDNPVFSLLLLENPNLLQDIPAATLGSIVKLERVPDEFIQWALNSHQKEILYGLAMNPKIKKDDLVKLIKKSSLHWSTLEVSKIAKFHVNFAGEMQKGWSEAAFSVVKKRQPMQDCINYFDYSNLYFELMLWSTGIIPNSLISALNPNTITEIARNPNTPAYILQTIFENPKTAIKKVIVAVASNPNTPPNLLEKLLGNHDIKVRYAAFQNTSISTKTFRKFYQYQSAVENLDTPAAILDEIAQTKWEYFRQQIAYHPNTSAKTLQKLAIDKNWYIRAAVATHPNLPINLIEKLAQDKCLTVRLAIVKNPNTPASLLIKFSQDKNSKVRRQVAKHPNVTTAILSELARDEDRYVRANVALNSKTNNEILLEFARDKYQVIRENISLNPNTPESALKLLTEDIYYYVRLNVAKHPNTPISCLKRLASDKHDAVRQAVAINIKTTDDILTVLELDTSSYIRELVKSIRQNKTLFSQPENFQNNETSTKTQISIDKNTSIEVLLSIAQSEKYPVYTEAIVLICQKITLDTKISTALLNECLKINDLDIKIALARHPKASALIFRELAKHPSVRLRQLLPLNHKIPDDILAKFLQDKNSEIRRLALARLLEKSSISNDKLNEFLSQWKSVHNPDNNQETLIQLATSKWVIIREALALQPKVAMLTLDSDNKNQQSKLKITLLEKLARDKHEAVKIAVTKNPHTPMDILELIKKENLTEDSIQLAVTKAMMQHNPESCIRSFFQDYSSVNSLPNLSRFFLLLYPLTPSEFLKKHCLSSSWLERYAIAQNPNTPLEVIQQLTRDANRIVRATAKARE